MRAKVSIPVLVLLAIAMCVSVHAQSAPVATTTPTTLGTWQGVTFQDVQWEYNQKLYKTVTVYTGNIVIPHLYVNSLYDGWVDFKIEWVKDVPLGTDVVVDTFYSSPYLTPGTNDIKLKSVTSNQEGKYFIRVYMYTGPSYAPEALPESVKTQSDYWVRIDPWTNPISNPGRSEVTFVNLPTTTPTPAPTVTPYPTPVQTPTQTPIPTLTPQPTPTTPAGYITIQQIGMYGAAIAGLVALALLLRK